MQLKTLYSGVYGGFFKTRSKKDGFQTFVVRVFSEVDKKGKKVWKYSFAEVKKMKNTDSKESYKSKAEATLACEKQIKELVS